MNKVISFLKDCGVFFVSTINKSNPATRPFGAVMMNNNKLYLSTGRTKDVYNQINENENIQIVALKNGTRDWIRIDGKAKETNDLNLKQEMLKECPILTKRYSSVEDDNFVLIEVEVKNYQIY